MPGETLSPEEYWEGVPTEGRLVRNLVPTARLDQIVIVDESDDGYSAPRLTTDSASPFRQRRSEASIPMTNMSRGVSMKSGRSEARGGAILSTLEGSSSVKRRAGPQNIFLTGSTGFVGCFLLDQLLDAGNQIYCLVRAESKEHGMARIRSTLDLYGLWRSSYEYSIVAVVGDLSKPLLGLELEQWDRLAKTMDLVVHCAAEVDYFKTYDELFPVNVEGTRQMLEFSIAGKVKHFHYMSALAVFSPISDLRIDETNVPSGKGLHSGYTQSKYVAETLVLEAGNMGRPCSIYRLGRITGHSQTGALPPQDLPFLLMKGIIEMGCFPMDLQAPVDIVPIDYCASLLAHFIRRQAVRLLDGGGNAGRVKSIGGNGGARHGRNGRARVFHITHPQNVTLPQVCLWLADMGYPIEGVSYARWRTRLLEDLERRQEESGPRQPLEPFLANFEAGLAEFKWVRFRCDRTIKDAESGGFTDRIVDVDAHLIRSYVDYLVLSGALPAPVSEALSPTRTMTRRTTASTRYGEGSVSAGAWGRGESPTSSWMVGSAKPGKAPSSAGGSTVLTASSTAPILPVGRRPSSALTGGPSVAVTGLGRGGGGVSSPKRW
ncbi:male sterility protein-domain-containing protein [Chytridium lagenaria]|nr:male sterility protein-domain-containing protein [Chytridium lagenaria]